MVSTKYAELGYNIIVVVVDSHVGGPVLRTLFTASVTNTLCRATRQNWRTRAVTRLRADGFIYIFISGDLFARVGLAVAQKRNPDEAMRIVHQHLGVLVSCDGSYFYQV